ncbi:hypothetical protein CGCF415_v015027 [Colletotrichum fructicola]|uniref:Uncharacterized protein n=2 Tax=Colletotrichum gloeosporioides species complex TaxID=2707338 RepID=L2FNU2_COLFN|nr:uncharacterized protein CGMCC3_g16636 [Colletotrichum fructicola]XP_045261527.1 uncharacterized protein GCG54_00003831 [Colletotrichum gloeosporioides]KAF4473636.1 hypothetical protein CGGC5_v017342 [Colletotrichum fructicola Nara gc5]KAE9567211.1 hypothetical protein CGMCC3_g16636 [Colletotrichum fructicola]KAF3802368.1 hypothetical protein GCG54_00003831 [Colletotrichum gloeosporioides]KAF4418584.1 hypothetical protein CFRS1_v015277 [Colletotrichum fructicola]KAF4882775.1 hypothetical pr
MRFPVFILSLLWLVPGALGAGRRAAYEKILFFYAYRIDQLLPEDQRTVGVKCAKWPTREELPCEDPGNNKPKYLHCKPKQPARTVCTLGEFIGHIDSNKGKNYKNQLFVDGVKWDEEKLDFDMKKTAENIIKYDAADGRNPPYRLFKDGALPAYYGDDIIKDGVVLGKKRGYDGSLNSIFDRMAYVKSTLPQATFDSPDVKFLFDRVEESRTSVLAARTADHDYWIKKDFVAHIPGIDVKTAPMGYQEWVDGQDRDIEKILTPETITANQAAIPNVEDQMKQVRADRLTDTFAGAAQGKQARDHQVVMECYEQGGTKIENAVCI